MFFLSSCWVYGQDWDLYDIGSYEPPNYIYRALVISPEMSMSNQDSSHKTADALSKTTQAASFSESQYSLLAQHRFRRYSKKFEFGSSTIMNSWYNAKPPSKSETDDLINDSKYFSRHLDANLSVQSLDTVRFYYPSKIFIGALASGGFAIGNTSADYGYAKRQASDTSLRITYFKQNNTVSSINPSFSLFTGGGWGRIRDVTFAAVALNMLDRIKDVQPQSAGISADGVQDFASYIEKRRRLRAFDGRLALIENIDALSQYLIDKKAVTGPSSAITMELADQWEYAFAQQRQAGFEFSLYPGIMVDYSRNKSSGNNVFWQDTLDYDLRLTDADQEKGRKGPWYSEDDLGSERHYQTSLTYCINSAVRYAKPINRFFQIDAQIDLNVHWEHYLARNIVSGLEEMNYEKLLPLFEANASCLLAFYPNTRTTFAFTPNISYNRSFDYLINEETDSGRTTVKYDRHNDFRRLDLEFPFLVRYYVSPRLQYHISATTYLRSLYSSDKAVAKAWYSSFAIDAGLTYQIF
jgi:hypothetical protein